jgi:uncharacterized cupredoxin-like copper-binding protein
MLSIRNVLAVGAVAATIAVMAPAWAAKKPKVDIELREWNVTLSAESVPAGEIDFSVKNKGKETHEVAIIKLNTDDPVGRLPIDKHGAIDEASMTFGKIIDEFEDMTPGKKEKKTINLKPGRYAIICNMVEKESDGTIEAHYSMGMSAQLKVE